MFPEGHGFEYNNQNDDSSSRPKAVLVPKFRLLIVSFEEFPSTEKSPATSISGWRWQRSGGNSGDCFSSHRVTGHLISSLGIKEHLLRINFK